MTVGKLRRLYTTALRLEVAFFDAQHVTAAFPRIGMLVTDFDDTCTASDTISTIIQTATEAKAKAAEASGRRLQQCGCSHLPCKTVADTDHATSSLVSTLCNYCTFGQPKDLAQARSKAGCGGPPMFMTTEAWS